jgi:hypothetical protein
MFLAAFILMLGPVQSGVQAGQPSLAATACIVFAISFDLRDRSIAAGCLLALAMALKLQLAAPFMIYFAFVGRWRSVFVAACAFATVTLVSIARLQLAGIPWMTDWLANVRRSTGPGGLNDFAAGVAMDHLLNLQLPLYAITNSRTVANIATLITVLAAAILYATNVRRERANATSTFVRTRYCALHFFVVVARHVSYRAAASPEGSIDVDRVSPPRCRQRALCSRRLRHRRLVARRVHREEARRQSQSADLRHRCAGR